MKTIDPKSLIIGVLATALVFACTDSNKQSSLVTEAKAAVGQKDKLGKNMDANKDRWLWQSIRYRGVFNNVTKKYHDGIGQMSVIAFDSEWEPIESDKSRPKTHVWCRRKFIH